MNVQNVSATFVCPENIGFLPSALWYITPTYSSRVSSKSHLLQEVAIDSSNEKIPLLRLSCTSLTKFNICCLKSEGFPRGSGVKNLSARSGDKRRIRSRNREDPLEKEMASHSSTLA